MNTKNTTNNNQGGIDKTHKPSSLEPVYIVTPELEKQKGKAARLVVHIWSKTKQVVEGKP